MRYLLVLTAGLLGLVAGVSQAAEMPEEKAPDYTRDVAPILTKYCTGCHNQDDQAGELLLDSYTHLRGGGTSGPAVLPGQPQSSRLLRVITGQSEPKMPPDDMKGPNQQEVNLLTGWIASGAHGPDGSQAVPSRLIVPEIRPAHELAQPVTALAWSAQGDSLAIGRFRQVELINAKTQAVIHTFADHPGKINSVEFSADGKYLVTASGLTGLTGLAKLWRVADGQLVAEFGGHQDVMYDAALSPDGKTLASASYDRDIILWDVSTKEIIRKLTGHNGAVYDVAFSPDGQVLASASGDETVKLWNVATGRRLDTLGQPEAEQYTVAFRPDGRQLVAGGADNRIRVWQLVSTETPKINPLLHARFAHEGAIARVAFTGDGKRLISVAEDRTLKCWETETYLNSVLYSPQPDVVAALAIAPGGDELALGRMDGTLAKLPIREPHSAGGRGQSVVAKLVSESAPLGTLAEQEPNNSPQQAMPITLPARITGVIQPAGDRHSRDADVFRFEARKGQQWVIEVNAARSRSPLDSRVEVLTVEGEPITRVLLQAVRDSYFTFRGKDSDTSNDFRVHNWEEMELNELMYAGGEVVKLWHYPRGPDSGFRVYPGSGKRWTYFDTTPNSHALHAPCYIVKAYPPGSELIPNGLPVFPVYYENDDESRRRLGKDSLLTFTAPADGKYLVRLTDTRSFGGKDYKYTLLVRPRQPDFQVRVGGANPTISVGSGREFTVTAVRLDNFDGPIRVELQDIPKGFQATSSLVIQAGQTRAWGTIHALPGAAAPSEELPPITVTASAEISGKTVTKSAGNLGRVKLGKKPQVLVSLHPPTDPANTQTPAELSDQNGSAQAGRTDPQTTKPLELVVHPGETISAQVRVLRNKFSRRISFGSDDSGRNLPHGVYVDNIGLNGLLIPAKQSEREFFITAAKWVSPTSRLFHLKANVDGGQTSLPVLLHVRPK